MRTKNAIIMIASIMVIVGTTLIPVLRQQVNAAFQFSDQNINQENVCFRSNTCRQSDVGQNTLGNDNQVTGFAYQSDNLQQTPTPTATPTPTPIPTPIPGACPEGTVFDVTLQATIGTNPVLPIGTVLCLQVAGPNAGIVAIRPGDIPPFPTISVIISPSINGACPASGVLPSPLSGTTVCVALQT
jgi:hypothetical protein